MGETSLFDRAVAAALPLVPRPMVRRFAAPYVAGLTAADALRAATALRDEGLKATIDVLGEAVTAAEAVERAVGSYCHMLQLLKAKDVPAGISLKLSGLGAPHDWDLCYDAVRAVVACAADHGRFVRIDMEDSSFVEPTLALYRRLRDEGRDNAGIVLQARLWRTPADLDGLGGLRPDVRLCKGVYLEPPELAAQEADAVRHQYSALLRKLLRLGCRVAVATHDEVLVVDALAALDEHRVSAENYEFQLLLGVRPDLARVLARAGHRVRIYVPYGADAYAYSVRRLRENPHLAGAVAKGLLADPAGAVRTLTSPSSS